MADQSSPRRRFQFRLRTLMLAVAIVAVQCAVCLPALKDWLERPHLTEREAANFAKKHVQIRWHSGSLEWPEPGDKRPAGQWGPYPQNPRVNDGAVDAVAASIRQYGWRQPIVADTEDVMVVSRTFMAGQLDFRSRASPAGAFRGR